jgi:hypothetical protein
MMNPFMTPEDAQSLDAFTTFVVCAVEVPLDEAVVPEVADQLLYIYGFDCYARWRQVAATSFPSLFDRSMRSRPCVESAKIRRARRSSPPAAPLAAAARTAG